MNRHFRTVVLAVFMLSTFMIVGLVQTPEAMAQPTVTGSDCSGCHSDVLATTIPATRTSPDPTIDWGVIIGGTPTAGSPATITVNENSTFELDFIIREMTQVSGSKDVSLRMMIGLPAATWSVGATSIVQNTGLTGWNANYEGIPWDVGTTSADFSTWLPNSPISREADVATSSWTANGRAFYDDASAGDLDGVAEKMGTDVLITVPSGIGSASPGTPYNIRIVGIGHYVDDSGKQQKGHVSAEITVNVVIGGGGDTTKPTVSSFTATTPVTTNVNIPITAFTATDDTAVTGYMISESATAPLAADLAWTGTAPATFTATAADGTKTLYPWAKDAAGNVSLVYGTPASVVVDGTGPTDGTLTVTPGNAQNDLSWTAATDAGVGLRTGTIYDVRFLTGATAPTCASGTSIYTGDNLTYLHPTLANGTQYSYRVCAYDTLNNPSTGATGTGTPSAGNANPDTPTTLAQYLIGGVTPIALGGYTSEASVVFEADIADSVDTGDTVKLQIDTDSNGTFDCESTLGTNPSTNVQVSCALADGSYDWQARTVDNLGAVSAWVPFNAATPDFIKDASAPVDGALTATAGNTEIVLTWAAASDAHSGLASPAYAVSMASGTTTPPADCSANVIYTGDALTHTETGLTNGIDYAFRLCADNNAGLTSTGSTDTAQPAAGCTPAQPTVSLAPGAQTITNDGGLVVYTVTVTNNDSACADATFSLSVNDTNGTEFYTSVLNNASMTIASGAFDTTTVSVQAIPGNDAVTNNTTVTATDSPTHDPAVVSAAVTTTVTLGGGCVGTGNNSNATSGGTLITGR